MKIMQVYQEQGLTNTTSRSRVEIRRGNTVFVDATNAQKYVFTKRGMIIVYPHRNGRGQHQLNLRVSADDRTTVRIFGLARQMKYALPRILARRLS